MHELFVKTTIYFSAILIPASLMLSTLYAFKKHGLLGISKTFINIIDYIIDKIENDLQKLIKFLIEQIKYLIDSVLNQALNIYIIAEAYNTVVNPPHGVWELFVSVLPFFIAVKKGNISDDLKTLNDIIKSSKVSKLINKQINEKQ